MPVKRAQSSAKGEYAHVVVVIRERPEVGIAEAGAQSKVGTGLPVVLKEDAEQVLTVIVAETPGNPVIGWNGPPSAPGHG